MLISDILFFYVFNQLGASTRGTAWFTSTFDHYQEAKREDLAALLEASKETA